MRNTLKNEIERLANLLESKGLYLATAESCTGGLIAKVCTDRSGSSAWFESGYVTYSNQSKQRMLGVRAETLAQFGAVSDAVVEEMALGASIKTGAALTVAVSGIAGPDGGTDEKPVGTVWIGWSLNGVVSSQCFHFQGDRESVRWQAVEAAVTGLIERAEMVR